MWVVTLNPKDMPGFFVARKHEILAGLSRPTKTFVKATSHEDIQRAMRAKGLTPLLRAPSDDPAIIESWI